MQLSFDDDQNDSVLKVELQTSQGDPKVTFTCENDKNLAFATLGPRDLAILMSSLACYMDMVGQEAEE
jgi:hypothetical protein